MDMKLQDSDTEFSGLAGRLPVKIGTRIRLVSLMNIVYVHARGNYVDIVMASGEILHTKEQLAGVENRLPRNLFARVHRSHIVNMEHVREIRTQQCEYELVLSSGAVVASSSAYRKTIRDRLFPNTANGNCGRNSLHGPKAEPISIGHNSEKKEGFRIRACSPGDEHLLTLLGQTTFIQTFAGLHPGEDILDHCANYHSIPFYRTWLEDKKTRIWMVETEIASSPVGYLAVSPATLPMAKSGDSDLEIQRIYLLDAYRDCGLEQRLFAEALRYAEDSRCKRLWASDYVRNDRKLKFYERVGFNARGEYQVRVGAGEYRDFALSLEI